MPRHSRRSIDRIFSKIIAANRRARDIITHEQITAYSAAKANVGEVMRAIQEQGGDVNGE